MAGRVGGVASQYMEGVQRRPKSAGARRPKQPAAPAPGLDGERAVIGPANGAKAEPGARPASAGASRRRRPGPGAVGGAAAAVAAPSVMVPEEFMAKKVDPLMKDLIAHLLSQRPRPASVVEGALAFMRDRAARSTPLR